MDAVALLMRKRSSRVVLQGAGSAPEQVDAIIRVNLSHPNIEVHIETLIPYHTETLFSGGRYYVRAADAEWMSMGDIPRSVARSFSGIGVNKQSTVSISWETRLCRPLSRGMIEVAVYTNSDMNVYADHYQARLNAGELALLYKDINVALTGGSFFPFDLSNQEDDSSEHGIFLVDIWVAVGSDIPCRTHIFNEIPTSLHDEQLDVIPLTTELDITVPKGVNRH